MCNTAPGHGSTAVGDLVWLAKSNENFQIFLQVHMTVLGIERHGHPGSQLCMTDSVLSISYHLVLKICSFNYLARQILNGVSEFFIMVYAFQ